jgi:hypothetical protein
MPLPARYRSAYLGPWGSLHLGALLLQRMLPTENWFHSMERSSLVGIALARSKAQVYLLPNLCLPSPSYQMASATHEYSINAAVLAVLFTVMARLTYMWLLPKPIPGIPHNPVASIWGDISTITQATKNGRQTFSDYVASVVERHGPLLQVSCQSFVQRSRRGLC